MYGELVSGPSPHPRVTRSGMARLEPASPLSPQKPQVLLVGYDRAKLARGQLDGIRLLAKLKWCVVLLSCLDEKG